MPSTRRSGRLSGVRITYANDELESNSADETSKTPRNKGKEQVLDDYSDEEFQAPPGEEEEDDDSEDDSSQNEDAATENDAEGGEVGAALEVNKGSRRRHKAPKISQPRSTQKRQPGGTLALTGEETHSRGTWNPLEQVGKSVHLQATFGLDERDILAILYARDRWSRGIDSTFPTRVSLDEAQSLQDYKYGSTFGAEPDDLKRETSRGWDWYYSDHFGTRPRDWQRVESIPEREARQTFMPAPQGGMHTVLLGPANNQKGFTLDQYDVLNFGDAWGEARGRRTTDQTQPEKHKKKRQGWIINLGQRVQCAAWAPNQTGLHQYLAVAAPITNVQKEVYPDPLKDHAAPAFRPSPPYPCALQLWSFKADKGDSITKTIDMSFTPKLRLALCTDWGDLRRMAWCPIPREPRDEDDTDAYKDIGLLAGVYSDGYVRVISVKISRDPNKADYYRVHSPVFQAKPPSTVCTCVTWLSTSDIAVGCANGFVAVWSIAPLSVQPQSGSKISSLPYVYHPIHSTYILNIASAFPTYPHLVVTTSMDGETRLSSLADCEKDVVDATRMRVGSPHLTYSPWLQSFISSDENDFVRLLTLRRFYTTTAVARLPSTISALATSSSWHPNVLLGCTGGSVIATNPLRRLLHAKEKQWQQTWFSHTWARGEEPRSSGTSRFYDGYRAESISLLRNMMGDRKLINGTMVITIYEEQTHITTLSWNPNQSCAGWASAGLGCGLLRVEDLAM
ncbi:transcription factor TFIIIC subunit TFC6 [Aspergillus lucknowensis]|uniref:Transcription factor TFIIIC complex subunit Tfc6 n=1 Tax=Aspergillus lucknowensis TaxID=176173 RepID=A0ABR4LUR9_9EURO